MQQCKGNTGILSLSPAQEIDIFCRQFYALYIIKKNVNFLRLPKPQYSCTK